ncbi:MAG TPA: hypothetical protein DC047_13790 [Blastocatellia bacterium]|nr:hypothetical protein [Blastocatellia bacterium]
MNSRKQVPTLLLIALFAPLCACHRSAKIEIRAAQKALPPIILWAWERPEDLEFLDPERFGVAFLAQTLIIKGEDVIYQPRHQPLKLSPETKLIAVTRIEGKKTIGEQPALSDAQRQRLLSLIVKTTSLQNVTAVQIDYDVAKSEREFYRTLLIDLRKQLPAGMPLTMTALASFCVADRWLQDLPVDEAVPMIFRMGLDNQPIKAYLESDNDFREPLCRHSYGIALDEPLHMKFQSSRRLYVFSNRAWQKQDVDQIPFIK